MTIAQIADVVTLAPVSGTASVRLCRKIDIDCDDPLSSQTVDPTTGVTFSIDAGFAGYVEVNSTGYQPALYFFNPPVTRNETISLIPVASTVEYGSLLGALGSTPSETRGSVVVIASDCTGSTAAGVSYSTPNADAESKVFYYVNGLPTLTQDRTDSTGYGGITNVPAGSIALNAKIASSGVSLPSISMVVRGDALTISQVVPFGN